MKPRLDDLLHQVAQQVGARYGVRCAADGSAWPRLTVRFDDAAHDVVLLTSTPERSAFHHLPGLDVSYERHSGQPERVPRAQERLLGAFLDFLGLRLEDLPSVAPRGAPKVERLDLVGACNLRCTYCGKMSLPALSLDDVERSFSEMHARHATDLGDVLLVLSGGEPTLSPLLLEVIRRARARGFADILVTTNGLRLSDVAYTVALVDAGLTQVELSLRSLRHDTYERLTRTTGTFAKAMAGLEHALARFDVLANLVINRWNYEELLELTQGLAAMHAASTHWLGLMPSIVVIEKPFVSWRSALAQRMREASLPNATFIGHLAQAVRWDHAQPQRIFLERFEGLCYAPTCAGRDYPELLEHSPRRPGSVPVHYVDVGGALPQTGRVKPTSCRSCRFDEACPGIAPGNAALYGFSDLVPC